MLLAESPTYYFPEGDPEQRPMLVKWPNGVLNLTGFAFGVYCAVPPAPGPIPSHTLRGVFNGTVQPGDSLRGLLVYAEQADSPERPTMVADSLGVVLGGSFAFKENGDTLSGLVNVRMQTTCKCATPAIVTLVRGML